MADSFRIGSGDGKTPEISKKPIDSTILEKIDIMEAATAFVAVQGIVVPTLNQLKKDFSYDISLKHLNLPSLMQLAANKESHFEVKNSNIQNASNETPIKGITKPGEQAHITLQQLKNDFSQIQKKIRELYKKRQEIINRWIDSTQSNPIQPNNQLFKDFYYLRETLEKSLEQINERIDKFEEDMPDSKDKDKLLEKLRTIYDDLISKIPEPNDNYGTDSGNWKPKPNALVDLKEAKNRMRFWWKEKIGDEAKVMKWNDSGDSTLPKNPLGIFEMIIDSDRSKYDDFLKTLSKGINTIKEFYTTPGSKVLHFFVLKNMNTESAYMYVVTVLLPLLQNHSAEILEEKGNTMKQISKIYNKWNEIQEEINDMGSNIKELFKSKTIKDQKVNFWDIIDHNGYKVGKFNDSKKIFQGLLKSKKVIDKKLEEFKNLLTQVEKKLPSSASSLVDTLKELSANLQLNKSKDFNFYYWNESEMRFEILAKDANLKDNKDYDKMNDLLIERLEEVYGFFINPDQTKFKAYMDNIAQGVTALTSISNMTQQEVQIASQYYNSLVGLQKNGFDSISKVIQIATKAPNY